MPSKHAHDLYPQWFTAQITQGSADAAIQGTVNLPMPRIPNSNKPTIIELLFYEIYIRPTFAAANNEYIWAVTYDDRTITTADSATFNNNGRTIGVDHLLVSSIGTTPATFVKNQFPIVHNLQANDGRGVLVAGDQMFVSFDSANTTGTMTTVFKFYFRYVDVALQEYVGLVQSQGV